MIPGVNLFNRKVSVASINGAGGSRGVLRSNMRQYLGSKEHQNLLKIDLNAIKIITIQDYKYTQN